VTERERTQVARDRARSIVSQLRESNQRAEREGAPKVDENQYRGLERTLTQKLLRTS